MHLPRSVGIGVALAAVFAAWDVSATAQDAAPHVFVCPPVTQDVLIDGELSAGEWDFGNAIEIKDEKQFVRKDPSYGGPADLSGRIYVARSATTLYVAGEVRDDTLFWNPKDPALGDGVEIFLDFHPRPESRKSSDGKVEPGYDEYAHQILLHPLANEVRWRFALFHGRQGRLDDEIDGVRLAGLPLRDAKGAAIGYKFELALPFSNFPDAPTAEGATFGFDVALSDSDGLPRQKNYATWSGHAELYRFPGRFGRIVLGKAPPPVAVPEEPGVSTIGPVAVLIAILGALLFLWLARVVTPKGAWLSRRLGALRSITPRWKLGAAGSLFVLIAAAGFLADGAAKALNAADVAQKRKIASLVRGVAEEADSLHLSEPQPPLHPSPLVSLLAGKSVKPPVLYDYTVIQPAPEEPDRTLSDVPFLRREVPATAAWSSNFVVEPPIAAATATVIYSWRPDNGVERTLKRDEKVAEIRLVRVDGDIASHVLLWGRDVDATDAPASRTSHPGAPEAKVAFLVAPPADGKRPAEHADESTWTLEAGSTPGASPSPIHRVEIEQTAAGGTLIVHGFTLTRSAGGEAVPLPLGRATISGVPTCASPFPGPDQGLQISRDAPKAYVVCDAPADKIWIVASLKRGFSDARFRAPVLLVEAVFDDGSVDGPFRLENGVSIDAESTPTRQHGDGYKSEVAFEWTPPGQPRRHYDAVPLELDRPGRRLTEVQFNFTGDDEIARISSITAGKRVETRRPPNLRSLESGDDGYRIAPQDLAKLEGLTFTMFRDGAAVATTASGDQRDRMLARSMSAEQALAAAAEPEGLHEFRVVEDRRLHALSIPLPGSRFLDMTWSSDVDRTVAEQVSVARAVLAALLAPLLILLLADVVLSVRSLHVRLVAAAAAVAAVPVALGWFAVPVLLGSTIEGRESESALTKSAAVKSRLSALRSQARQRAEAALRDDALQEALRRRGAPEFRGAVSAALRDLERGLGGDARVALEVLPLSSAGEPIVFPEDVRWTVFADRTATLTDELAYRLSRLTATGVAQQYDTAGDWRTTLVVELPLERAALVDAAAAAGGGVQALLYSPHGYPMVSTLDARGEDLPEETRHKEELIRQVLARQQPKVETRVLAGTPHTVAYDVLRGEAGVVGLVGTAVPRGGADALLRQIEFVALLVFGAGVAMQFLLAGVVVASTSKPFLGAVGEARDAAGLAPPLEGDEISALATSLATLRADRDAYKDELARLADAAPSLAADDGPDAVVERSLAVLRTAVEPWGAFLIAADADGRVEVLGGFRGRDSAPRGPVVVVDAHPFAAVIAGRGEVHLTSPGAAPEISVRGDRPLVGGASRVDAWPIGGPDRPGGALVLLAGPDAADHPRKVHDRFVAAFARNVGAALANARLVRLAVHDADTNAYVPGFFAERLEEEVDRAVTGRRHVALLLLKPTATPADAAAARRGMQQLAETVRAAAPARCFLGRIEADVLAVAAPETDRAAADALALEMRRVIAERRLADLRVRIGVAACPDDAGSVEFLQAEARRGLASEADARPSETSTRRGDDRARLVAEARGLGAVFESETGLKILETIERIAGSDLSILVDGETGSGKEVVADLIHEKSGRRARPMVKVNCAALPDALLESELFGYERGAFTGADRTKPGRFELADGGTIFLDEIGDMPLATQVKLLRVLEDRAVEHLGGTAPTPIDVRVIAATNRDLRAAIAAGRFREDLYYRLSAVTLSVPPLRARKEDIPRLAERFGRLAAESHGHRPPEFAPDAMDLLYRHAWPGNVRELRNVVEQAVVLSNSDVIRAADLALAPTTATSTRPRAALETRRTEPSPRNEPPRTAPGAISDRQRRLLALLSERAWATNGEYCDLVGVSQRTGLRDLQELLERGVIVMEGKRRGARYRLR